MNVFIREGEKMEKENFVEKMQRVLGPIGQKIGSQRHLAAISSGIIMTTPITLLAAFINIIANPPVTKDLLAKGGFWSIFSGWYHFAQANYNAIMTPYNMTIGIFGLVAVMAISYKLAKSYKMDAISTSIVATVMFLLVASPMKTIAKTSVLPASCLGSSGLFAAMLVGLVSVEITRFVKDKGWVIKLPQSVPADVAVPFTAIIPALINLVIWYTISLLCQNYAGCYLPDFLTKLLSPLFNVVLNPFTVCGIILFGNLLWLFGIHGTSVVYTALMPILMMNMMSNSEAYLKGAALTLYPSSLLFWMGVGGTGCTLGLCILMMRSQSAQLKTIGRLAIIPNFFGINEPIIFGVPIVLNPILAIPFLLIPAVCGLSAYALTALGILKIWHIVIWTMLPLGFVNFIATGSIINTIYEYFLIVVQIVLWYPFFKAYEKTLLDKENAYVEETQKETKEAVTQTEIKEAH